MTTVNRVSQRWSDWCEEVPFDCWEADLDGVDPVVAASCLEWVDSLTDSPEYGRGPSSCGRNLVITGPPGVGKTWAAYATCKQLRWVGHPHQNRAALLGDPGDGRRPSSTRHWSVANLLARLRANEAETWAYLRTAGVPFLDDIGSMRSTDWVLDQMYSVLDYFRSNRIPVIATTNLQLPDLEAYLGSAAYSRLMSGSVACEMRAHDRRKD